MRITSGMLSSQYSRDLNRATYDLNRAATTAYTFRAFDKPSDDPFVAAQTFQIRRQLALNENCQSNLSNVRDAASTAESTLQKVANILSDANNTEVLRGITGTSSQSDRNTIADQLLTMRDALVSDMNIQYGNRYLFAGAGTEAPFTVEDGTLFYRGINVDTGENTNGASAAVSYEYPAGSGKTSSMQINFGKGIGGDLNGYKLSISAGTGAAENAVSVDTDGKTIAITLKDGATKQDLQNLLQGVHADGTEDPTFSAALSDAALTDPNLGDIGAGDLSQITISGIDQPGIGVETVQSSTGGTAATNHVDLKALADEKVYVDIGIGMKVENGQVLPQSAFNASMPGIDYLGYGMTPDTDVPKNAYSLLGDIASILKDDSLSGESLTDALQPYLDSFQNTQDEMLANHSELGGRINFLDSTQDYLDSVNLNLTTRDNNVEFVDPANAITDYTMQQFCYQAALQIGNSILQPTLLDFMK